MIDWVHVNQLRTDVGDGFDEIVEVFLQEVSDRMARVDVDADLKVLAADLHFLKGAALNLGFQDFAERCSRGEESALAGRRGEVTLSELVASFEETRTAFIAGLSRRAA